MRGVARKTAPGEETKVAGWRAVRDRGGWSGHNQVAVVIALNAAEAASAKIQFNRRAELRDSGIGRAANRERGEVRHSNNQRLDAVRRRCQRRAETNISRARAAGRHGQSFDVEARTVRRFWIDSRRAARGETEIVAAFAVAIRRVPVHQIELQVIVSTRKCERHVGASAGQVGDENATAVRAHFRVTRM